MHSELALLRDAAPEKYDPRGYGTLAIPIKRFSKKSWILALPEELDEVVYRLNRFFKYFLDLQ